MSIVDKIQQLTISDKTNNEYFRELEEALSIYHQLVKEGKLIPRGNTLENDYTIYAIDSNFNA